MIQIAWLGLVMIASCYTQMVGAQPIWAGRTHKLINPNSGLCIDVPAGQNNSGARLQVWPCNGADPQRFIATSQGRNTYSFANAASNKCIDVFGGRAANGTPIDQWDCNQLAPQRFTLAPSHGSIYRLIAADGRCLDIPNASRVPGTPLQTWDCNGSAAQQWAVVESVFDDGGTYNLKSNQSAKCADAANAGAANGTPIAQIDCSGSNSQKVIPTFAGIDPQGSPLYQLVHVASKRCMEVRAVSAAAGTPIQLWDCLGTAQANQLWTPLDLSGAGAYRLQAQHDGQVLDLPWGSSNNGVVLQQWPANGANAQLWTLQKAAPVASPFVRTAPSNNGPIFVKNGQPFFMKGYQTGLYRADPCGWTQAQLYASLDRMQQGSGANTVRMWFYQYVGGPQNWAVFDDAIAQVKKRGMVAIITLVNQWGDCEPNNRANQKNYKTLGWYQSGYKQAIDGYGLSYRDYVAAVAAHFANEPAIAMYQLVNEAEARDPINNTCVDDRASANAIRAFADDMVGVIHRVDTNHLVNLGTQDNGWCGVQDDDFSFVHGGAIDVCEVHTYDAPNKPLSDVVAHKIAQCKALGKPIFMGEAGICNNIQADATTCSGAPNLSWRAGLMTRRMQANRQAGLAGFLIWDWSFSAADPFGVNAGDPMENEMKGW